MSRKITLSFLLLTIGINLLNAQTITVGTGTLISAFSPIIRSYDYCLYEVIYQAGDINFSGDISAIGFQRVDGNNIDSIADVSIYMKQTSNATVTAGTYDSTGYVLVFHGKWPNETGSGWRERQLDTVFSYSNTSNLQVLIVKGYEPAVGNTPVSPRWYYTTSSIGTPARRYYGNSPITAFTNLSATNVVSNIRLQFNTVGIIEIANNQTQIYPNPSSDKVHFDFAPESDIRNISVYNSNGQIILNAIVESNFELQTKNLPKGIYYYRLSDSKNNIVRQGKLLLQ